MLELDNVVELPNGTRKLTFVASVDSQPKPGLLHEFLCQQFASYLKGRHHLDVGCWNGAFLLCCRSLTGHSVGLELLLPPLIAAARFCGKGVSLINGNTLTAPFANEVFEVVTFLEVIEHLPRGTEHWALRELNRILKPGGYLLLSTPNTHPLGILLDPAFFISGHRHYSERTITSLLRRSGFEVVETLYTRGIISTVIHLVFLVFKHLLHRNLPEWDWLRRVQRREYSSGRSPVNSFGIQVAARKVS